MAYVVMNVLTVPDGRGEVLEQRFANRAGMVENSAGFEHFELLRPVEGTDQYLVYTRWRSEEDFEAWMRSSMENAHRAGGRPAAADSQAWTFEVIQQAAPKAG